MSGGRLPGPGGRHAPDPEYTETWHALGAAVARALGEGWELSGYDPVLTLRTRDWEHSEQVSTRVALAIQALLARAEAAESHVAALERVVRGVAEHTDLHYSSAGGGWYALVGERWTASGTLPAALRASGDEAGALAVERALRGGT